MTAKWSQQRRSARHQVDEVIPDRGLDVSPDKDMRRDGIASVAMRPANDRPRLLVRNLALNAILAFAPKK
jgi:hypothetical protein